MLWLLRDVHRLGHAHLHAKGQFVLRNAGEGFGIADGLHLHLVELLERVERLAAAVAIEPGGIGEKQHRIAIGAALHALVDARQKSAAPDAHAGVGRLAAAGEDDKAGQILVFRAQAVGGPGAQARAAEQLRAGVQQKLRRGVVELLGVHRLDDRDIVEHVRQMLPDLAEPRAARSMLREFERRAEHLRHALDKGEPLALEKFIRAVLAVELDQRRACNRTDRAATASRPCADRSPPWPWGNAAQLGRERIRPALRRVCSCRHEQFVERDRADRPVPSLPKKWRRVIALRIRAEDSSRSAFGQKLIQVQDHVRHRRQRRHLRRIGFLRQRTQRSGRQLLGLGRVCFESPQAAPDTAAASTAISFASRFAKQRRSKATGNLRFGDDAFRRRHPPRQRLAHSTNTGSFSVTSACNGVLVRDRRTVQVSRLVPSKVNIDGYGVVRLMNVYIPRRN